MLLVCITIQFLLSGVMSDCPNDCQCFNETLKCRQIPQLNYSSAIEYRTFILENSSPKLDVQQLSSLNEVQVMGLNGLNLENVANDDAGVILQNLTTLNLSFNKITNVVETTFTWCPHLINLDLSNNNIKNVGRLTLNSIESLNLSHNSIYSGSSFANLPPSLIMLDLNNNGLDEVPQLNHLTRLRDLHLCGNDYESWPGDEINNCAQLKSLCLGDLMVNEVSRESAIAQFTQLTHLHLINKNKIHPTILKEISSLVSLQSLRIDFAKIVDLGFLNHLSKLERLELIDVKVPIDLKSHPGNLKNIKYVDLSGSENLAKALLENHETFDTLTTLFINGNNVSTVPFSSLPQLARLDLSENPLLCDENLINLVALQTVTILHPKQTVCNLPPEFSGLNLKDVMSDRNNSLLKSRINSINFTPSNNETEESKLGLFLDRVGISRDHLFYIGVGLIALLVVCTAVILLLAPSKCKKRGGVTHTGWRGRFGEGDSLCNDDAFFPKADNEYIFDNFSVSDTIARNANPLPLTNQSSQ